MNTHVNLLPAGYRRKQLLALRLRQWFAVWTLAAPIMAGLAWTDWSGLQSGAERLRSLQQDYGPIRALQQESESIAARIQELEQREALVFALADQPSMLALVGQLSRAARDCEGRVSVQKLELRRRQGVGTEDAANGLVLEGVATDNQSVAGFAEALRDARAFARVELQSSESTHIGEPGRGVEARSYRLECAF
jgi:hypothetical protein